jgi:hypothetical protein
MFWHIPNAIPTSSATCLIVRRQSAQMISLICATVSSVWEVDSLPGRGSSSKDRRPLLKWQYNSNVFNRLRQDSLKAACSISYISAPVFPRWKQKLMHTHAPELSPPSWDVTHTAGRCSLRGFHRANAGRYQLLVMQVHLHRVAICPALLPFRCILRLPQKKKSVPELNDQSSYKAYITPTIQISKTTNNNKCI